MNTQKKETIEEQVIPTAAFQEKMRSLYNLCDTSDITAKQAVEITLNEIVGFLRKLNNPPQFFVVGDDKVVEIYKEYVSDYFTKLQDNYLTTTNKHNYLITESYDIWRLTHTLDDMAFHNISRYSKSRVEKMYVTNEELNVFDVDMRAPDYLDLSEDIRKYISGYLLGPVVLIDGKMYESTTHRFTDMKEFETFIINHSWNNKIYVKSVLNQRTISPKNYEPSNTVLAQIVEI